MNSSREISDDVLAVISRMHIVNNVLESVPERLDRKLYEKLDKVLTALGGKWNRKTNGHQFPADPSELVGAVIATGRYDCPRLAGYFPTPSALARQLATELHEATAALAGPVTYLEPSAGTGVLAQALVEAGVPRGNIVCVENNEGRANVLNAAGFTHVRVADFLTWTPDPWGEFDAILMNPPFNKGADIAHVGRALGLLREGGKLRAIMSAGVTFRTDTRTRVLRDWLQQAGATIEPLPDGTFDAAGTGVRTVVVRIG